MTILDRKYNEKRVLCDRTEFFFRFFERWSFEVKNDKLGNLNF